MYLIHKTKLKPVNGYIYCQRVQSTKTQTKGGLILPALLTEKFIVVAKDEKAEIPFDLEVGDVVMPYHEIMEDMRRGAKVDQLPPFLEVFDDELEQSFDCIHWNAIRGIDDFSKRGKTWDFETENVKSGIIIENSAY